MLLTKSEQIRALLKSIETGDPGPVAVVNEAKYVQHNPQTHEGSEGLAALFKRLSSATGCRSCGSWGWRRPLEEWTAANF